MNCDARPSTLLVLAVAVVIGALATVGVATAVGPGGVVAQADATETTIEASASGSTAAFDQPVQISGEIRTADDEPLADRQVTLQVGERTYEPRTDSEGAFDLTYRPVGVALDSRSVAVAYRPANGTGYAGSSTTVALSITQVTPNVTVSAEPSTARFGTNLTADADASVGGRNVPDLPVEAELGDESVGTARTGADGTATGRWPVPASVPPGAANLTVTVGADEAAVGSASETAALTIEETPTAISADAAVEDGAIVVDGQLTIDDDRSAVQAPANLTVDVTVAGQTRSVETEETGAFSLSLQRSELNQPETEVAVAAAFSGESTNLGPASAEGTVRLTGGGSDSSIADIVVMAYAGIAFVVLVVVAIIGRRRRRSGDADQALADSTVGHATPSVVDSGAEVSDDALAETDDSVPNPPVDGVEVSADADVPPEPAGDAVPQPDAVARLQDGQVNQAEPDAAPEPDPGTAPEPEPDEAPEPEPDEAPEPEPDEAPEPEPDEAPEPEPDEAPEPDPGTAPEPDPDTAPEPDPAPDIEPEAPSDPEQETPAASDGETTTDPDRAGPPPGPEQEFPPGPEHGPTPPPDESGSTQPAAGGRAETDATSRSEPDEADAAEPEDTAPAEASGASTAGPDDSEDAGSEDASPPATGEPPATDTEASQPAASEETAPEEAAPSSTEPADAPPAQPDDAGSVGAAGGEDAGSVEPETADPAAPPEPAHVGSADETEGDAAETTVPESAAPETEAADGTNAGSTAGDSDQGEPEQGAPSDPVERAAETFVGVTSANTVVEGNLEAIYARDDEAGEGPDEFSLAGARVALDDGHVDRAVANAYAATHRHLTATLALEGIPTPRSLVAVAEGQVGPEAHDALERLTDAYEQMIFASETTPDLGELAIEAAAVVLDGGESDGPGPQSGGTER